MRLDRRPVFEPLDGRILLAGGTVFTDVQPAALDQPRVNVLLRRSMGGPLVGNLGGQSSFNVEAFYDTGASGVLLSNETADLLGIARSTYAGKTVVYQDVGVAGSDSFNVSEPLYMNIAPYNPNADIDNIDTWQTVYNQVQGPMRTQVGAVPAPTDPMLQNLDVVGVSAMQGKVVVMDPKPVDTFTDTMRTYVYNPGTAYNSAAADSNPGIPAVNRHILLSYGDFSRFTSISPAGAPGPTLRSNPFIGANPVAKLDTNPPVDNTPGLTAAFGAKSTTGSWLLDTGAAASMISRAQAAKLGITYVSGTFGTSDPQLSGVPLADQFTLTIGGIGGTTKVAGFFLSSLSVPTMEGQPIVFDNAPVLVSDVTVKDPVTAKTLTLDGVFGMNYLTASAYVTEGGAGGLPSVSNLTAGHFDWVVFDQPSGVLGVDIPGAPVITDTTKPWASSASAANVTTAGANSYTFTVTYADNIAVKTSTLDGNDVRVTGPNGYSQLAQFVSVNNAANGTPRTATYRITPPGGTWDKGDSGTYTIALQGGQVADTANNTANAVASLKSFNVAITSSSPGTISGTVFNDANANATKDTGEGSLAATVFLDLNNNGVRDTNEPMTTSSSRTGSYAFANVSPGTYIVRQVAPSGYRQTLPRRYYSVTVAAGQAVTGINFGDTTRAYVSGVVWNDANANKAMDTGEAGLAGWRVFIDANGDGKWQSSELSLLTDSTGNYAFTSLAPGQYVIRVVAQSGWTATSRAAQTVTLGSGQVVTKLGFGEKK